MHKIKITKNRLRKLKTFTLGQKPYELQKLNSNNSIKNADQKKYEMNLTSGNINFLKILSIIVLVFFITYWSLRIINN